jgi:hypothetical protein
MFRRHALDDIIPRHSHFTRRSSAMNLTETPDLKATLRGSSTGGHGPDLTGYQHLTYAPAQWGQGVRVASNGASVDMIANDPMVVDVMESLDELASAEGISLDELFDCLRYARSKQGIAATSA